MPRATWRRPVERGGRPRGPDPAAAGPRALHRGRQPRRGHARAASCSGRRRYAEGRDAEGWSHSAGATTASSSCATMSCANRRPPRPRSRPAAWRRSRSATRWQSWSPRRRPIVTRPPHARLTPSGYGKLLPRDQRAQRRRRGRDPAHIRGAARCGRWRDHRSYERPRRGRHVDRHPGPGSGDEIGRMAQALGVFRDTAVEIEQSNLRESRRPASS